MGTTEYHVSRAGDDDAAGTADAPLASIDTAAKMAEPGTRVVVHEGTYRERVDPPRGGDGPDDRIVFTAAAGEDVEVTGSEVVDGWQAVADDVWRVTLEADFFGEYNPFAERIRGDWFDDRGRDHHTGAVYVDRAQFPEAESLDALQAGESHSRSWYAAVEDGETTIWVRVEGTALADAAVEVNARPAVFYPSEPGRDYITVRGFTLRHAATQWAPPTTEQIGLLGTHWSTGWVIEDNEISHSRCTGITLGKYGPSVDETGASAERYNDTIEKAIDNGWQRGSIGHHVVRNNEIHHCEQAGIVGSMGGAFSTVTDNYVHDVNLERQFEGEEIAGIKFHGAIDSTIARNCIARARRGLWLDWMTQGTLVSGNVFLENTTDDVFLEVNHGPFVLENNVMLSDIAIRDWSQGGAYVHNLIGGRIRHQPEPDRRTPYLKPRSTEIAGLSAIGGGDDRFYNNLILDDDGLAQYDDAEHPVSMAGNVSLGDAEAGDAGAEAVELDADTAVTVTETDGAVSIAIEGIDWDEPTTELVTTRLLGSATLPDAPFTEPDGTTLRADRDYFGTDRDLEGPAPGPFDALDAPAELTLWPR